jgi:hypothetical protein
MKSQNIMGLAAVCAALLTGLTTSGQVSVSLLTLSPSSRPVLWGATVLRMEEVPCLGA